jgi:hypothetical protein
MSYPPAGPYVFGASACNSRRTPRNTVGMPIVTSINVMIRPRPLRNTINRVVIIAQAVMGEPRRSGGVGRGRDSNRGRLAVGAEGVLEYRPGAVQISLPVRPIVRACTVEVELRRDLQGAQPRGEGVVLAGER